jgi:hypothetical protein
VAIVACFNEADVIEQTTRDLIDNGIDVYILDDGSTDGTPEIIRPLVGRGVIGIEQLPSLTPSRFSLRRILVRKEQLASTLDADWFINHDADEIRESPWSNLKLTQAIGLVDRLGWNAIDFQLLNFWPTSNAFRAGDDLRASFPYWKASVDEDRLQIRCWKRAQGLNLASTGGHEARFEGRRVFPIRFLLRHYPVRNQLQGERKIWSERVPRFSDDERASGWHVQYQGLNPNQPLLASPLALTRYDPERVRLDLFLRHRDFESVEASARSLEEEVGRISVQFSEGEVLRREAAARDLLAAITTGAATIDGLRSELRLLRDELTAAGEREQLVAGQMAEVVRARDEFCLDLNSQQALTSTFVAELESARAALAASEDAQARTSAEVNEMRTTRSWRWTAPLRRLLRRR